MKKLTLNEAWRLCLMQWRWIAMQIRKGTKENVETLKREWCLKNGFENMCCDCFFCEYDYQKVKERYCFFCPAYRIDKKFHCENGDYNYTEKPLTFYKKLLELNRKRK